MDTQETKNAKSTDTVQKELSDLLVSESDDGDVLIVQIGNESRCAKVEIQGVPVYGILDAGADITIIGGKLFKLIATKATPRLKKKDPQQPDKVSRNYNGNTFTLDGKMDLKVSFQGKNKITPIYIKMDAKDQLLLSETVCQQLGIVSYHPMVKVWSGGHHSNTQCTDAQSTARVPVVRVKLVQATRFLPQQTTVARMYVYGR